jgi:hypothetical protein
VAIALAAVLLGGVHALTVRTEAAANARQAAFEQTLNELQNFVAEHRGGPFVSKVRAKLLGDKEFALALDGIDLDDPVPTAAPEPAEPPAEPDDFGATMVGLGIADPGDDAEAEERALSDGVYGFYDTDRGRLYVRGRTLNAFARMVLVHELTHAWQDQHFGLDTVRQGVETLDEVLAVTALIEGDASRIERAWHDTRSPAERAEIDAYEAGLGGGGSGEQSRARRAIGTLRSFPYVAGRAFADAVAARGGNPAVDQAFLSPPVSSEQVLHPAAYARHEAPLPVASPGDDDVRDVRDTDTLGEVGLALVLGGGRVDAAALRAAAGWGGDSYATWRDPSRTCTRITVVMDDAAARDRLLRALRDQHVPDRTLLAVAPRGLDMTTCVEDP